VRRLVSAGFASLVAVLALTLTASPVAAECSFVPPWPKATEAIRSAKAVIVGEVVTDFDVAGLSLAEGEPRSIALLVTEVMRGDYEVGGLVDIELLAPNWPWTGQAASETYPSCSQGPGRPGDVIVLALGAVQPPQRVTASGFSWWQPRTEFNAVGVVVAGPLGLRRREAVTLSEVRRLTALPQTDTSSEQLRSGPGALLLVAFIAGLIGGALAWRRTGASGASMPPPPKESEPSVPAPR